jgi:osmotically inducible lipoprotein OsmB
MRISITFVLGAALLLSACGQTPTDRAVTGAGIGAAGGAMFGALIGAPFIGAMVGAAGGASVGAATDPSDIYLGKPVYK